MSIDVNKINKNPTDLCSRIDYRSKWTTSSIVTSSSFSAPCTKNGIYTHSLPRPLAAPRLRYVVVVVVVVVAPSAPPPPLPPPDDFGAHHGTPIHNKATVLAEVDAALYPNQPARPPDLEVILTDHIAYLPNRWVHAKLLRWGHVAVRYTTSDGTQRVMNILGGDAMHLEGARMVNFVDPGDYIYGTERSTLLASKAAPTTAIS